MAEEELLQPLKAYESLYKDKVHTQAEVYFESLVTQSQVDADGNRLVNNKIKRLNKEKAALESKIGGAKVRKALGIIFGIIFILCAIIPIILGVQKTIPLWLGIIIAVAAVALGVFLIVAGANMSKKIRALQEQLEKLIKEIKEAITLANEQMAPLNALYDWNMQIKVINSVIPTIELDEIFDGQKEDKLVRCYGLGANDDENYSSLYVQSGSVLGNPFLIRTAKNHQIVDKVYTGSIVITWRESYTDSKGNTHWRTRTQTLTASSTHPAPEYRKETELIYGNAAAPDLVFSRKPQIKHGMGEKDIAKWVDKESKELRQLAEKSVAKGGKFTPMANNKFETMFQAYNRTNEQQFRLLFTALGQRNIEDLLTSGIGYGDDFYFYKNKMINIINSRHSQVINYSGDPKLYITYDIDESKKLFVESVDRFFKGFYFDMAPLMSIPLYQQMKSLDYIYGDDTPNNYSSYEHEVLANSFDPELFRPKDTITDIMLKTRLLRKDGKSDKVSITGYAYRGEDRVDYHRVLGGDGNFHTVPVHWVEYFREEKTQVMEVKSTYSTLVDFRNKIADNYLNNFFGEIDGYKYHSFQRGLLAFFPLGSYSSKEDEQIGQYFKK